MNNKHRILTNIGEDQVINVELNQNFDMLEILSMKFTQKEIYTSMSADYGVVVGRISVNNGFGIPNARVSIFIPLDDVDENDPLISTLYPYKNIDDRDENNYRYNLLPKRKQHGGHEPTGTFPDQSDILNREEILEVYEKYYKYTVRTNDSGDFMIWGVPLGEQILHVDVDLSDIGCFSLRPYDFIRTGVGEDQFKNSFKYKSSNDIDSLPQIKTFNKTINVYPFWGNESLSEIGITRSDFDLSTTGFKIEPKAFLIGGIYTDTNKNSINKNCSPRVKMGRKCDLTTKTGKIESIRFTTSRDQLNRPLLENFEIDEDIPEDGGFVFPIPMNMDFIYTNEYGENEYTNDPNRGIATSACYRFRVSMDEKGNSRTRKTASYLVPNIREYTTNINSSYAFSTSWENYPGFSVNEDPDQGILYNEDGVYYPRDYFYRMSYNKVYTVSSFHSMYYKRNNISDDKYIGLKELVPTEEEDCSENVTPPVNFGLKNRTFTLILADVFLLFEHLMNVISLFIINTVTRFMFKLGRRVDVWPVRKVGREIKRIAYNIQEDNQKELYLIAYPECETCNDSEYGNDTPTGESVTTTYCEVGKLTFTINGDGASLPFSPTFNDPTPNPQDPCNSSMITGATYLDKLTYFVNNQSTYKIYSVTTGEFITFDTSADSYVSLSGSSLIFNDTEIQYRGTYECTILVPDSTSTLPNVELESGCELYDAPYDESMITYYLVRQTNGSLIKVPPGSFNSGMDVVSTNISNAAGNGFSPNQSDSGSSITDTMYFYTDNSNGSDVYHLVDNFEGDYHVKKTESGQSEFRNGMFTIVPGAQTNTQLFKILKEYRRRKRVGKLFCGGIVNYSFVDNWLSGSLYFFQFKGKEEKYCEDIVRYVPNQNRFYYRSSKFNNSTKEWGTTNWQGENKKTRLLGRPTTMVDLGPRDEFIKEICTDPSLDPNCSVVRSIGPTSFQSFGELLGLAINYRMDISNNEFDINNFFDNKGFGFDRQKVFDGDITQLISINNEVGIEEFDLQSPKYAGYSYQFLDPDTPAGKSVFMKNGKYGPLPITFYFDDDGERVRACLNEPTHLSNDQSYYIQGRLTEASQKVPFFLWDKKGSGFGSYDENISDDQSWSYNDPQLQPLQGMTYAYNLTNPEDDSSDKYLLLPMTYDFDGLTFDTGNGIDSVEFTVVDTTGTNNHQLFNNEYPGFTYLYVTASDPINGPTQGILYTRYGHSGTWKSSPWDYMDDFMIRYTRDYYTGNKQILSTPFMFYFGLKSGKTGVDKFIQFFGDKNDFTTED